MSLFEKVLGPKSKYDNSIPYTYEARIQSAPGSDEYNSYFADTICSLVEYLNQQGIKADEVQIFEIYQQRESHINVMLFTTPDHQWLFKPDLCHAFEEHYKGHIQGSTCSFNDRNCAASGP